MLATVNEAGQPSAAGGALVFSANPLISGTTISHQAGSDEIIISRTGIYQVSFHSTVTVDTGTAIPSSVTARLYNQGTPAAGAIASHTFSVTGENANLSFNAPIQVTTAPASLRIVISTAGYTFSEVALTVTRLGDAR